MVGRSKRSEGEGSLSDRIAVLSARRAAPVAVEVVPPVAPVPEAELPTHTPPEDRLTVAKEQLIARLSAEVRPERRSLLREQYSRVKGLWGDAGAVPWFFPGVCCRFIPPVIGGR